MPDDNVVRISDYDRKSREPDAAHPRDPADSAVIIILPAKTDRHDDGPPADSRAS